MFQNSCQQIGNCFQSLHRNANTSVVQATRPAWYSCDVKKAFLRVQNHCNLFRRRVVQLRFQNLKLILQRVNHFRGQLAAGASVIAQYKVARFAFTEIAFCVSVAFGFF